jgi:hypothetical protein
VTCTEFSLWGLVPKRAPSYAKRKVVRFALVLAASTATRSSGRPALATLHAGYAKRPDKGVSGWIRRFRMEAIANER